MIAAGKTVEINFFRSLEIIQRLTAIQRMLTQGKWLHLSQNSELCGILTWLFPMPSSQLHVRLEKQQLCNHSNCKQLETSNYWRGRYMSGAPPKAQRIVLLWPVWKLPGTAPLAVLTFDRLRDHYKLYKQPYPQGVGVFFLLKRIIVSVLYHSCLRLQYQDGKQRMNKSNIRNLWTAMSRRGFEKLWNIPGSLEGHIHV